MPVDPPQADRSIQSLHVVMDELTRAQTSHEQRRASVETKAGLILGAAGVLVGLKSSEPTVVGIVAQVLAAAAGVLAVSAIWPRAGGALSPMAYRMAYIHKPPGEAQLRALDTHILLLEDDEEKLKKKAAWFKRAAALLALAVVIVTIGSIVDFVAATQTTEQRTDEGRVPSVNTSRPSSGATLEPGPRPHR